MSRRIRVEDRTDFPPGPRKLSVITRCPYSAGDRKTPEGGGGGVLPSI